MGGREACASIGGFIKVAKDRQMTISGAADVNGRSQSWKTENVSNLDCRTDTVERNEPRRTGMYKPADDGRRRASNSRRRQAYAMREGRRMGLSFLGRLCPEAVLCPDTLRKRRKLSECFTKEK